MGGGGFGSKIADFLFDFFLNFWIRNEKGRKLMNQCRENGNFEEFKPENA